MTSCERLGQTLSLFLEELHERLGPRLVSLLLYGSAVFDDLAPGYGELDFLAVIDRDLTEQDSHELVELRRPLREGRHGALAAMLEGAFLPALCRHAPRPADAHPVRCRDARHLPASEP
jgi:hypothetical protein